MAMSRLLMPDGILRTLARMNSKRNPYSSCCILALLLAASEATSRMCLCGHRRKVR
jgi:hypothetical protein